MGMGASVDIWVGLNVSDYDDMKMLESSIPEEVLEIIDCSQGGSVIGDIAFEFFGYEDDAIGFGVSLLHHNWNDNPKSIDLLDLASQSKQLKVKVAKIFRSWGMEQTPEVWISSGISL